MKLSCCFINESTSLYNKASEKLIEVGDRLDEMTRKYEDFETRQERGINRNRSRQLTIITVVVSAVLILATFLFTTVLNKFYLDIDDYPKENIYFDKEGNIDNTLRGIKNELKILNFKQDSLEEYLEQNTSRSSGNNSSDKNNRDSVNANSK